MKNASRMYEVTLDGIVWDLEVDGEQVDPKDGPCWNETTIEVQANDAEEAVDLAIEEATNASGFCIMQLENAYAMAKR